MTKKTANLKKYISALAIGFLTCWCLFYSNFSGLYSVLLSKLSYRGITYFALFLFSYIVCVIFYDLFSGFIEKERTHKIVHICKWIITFALFGSLYAICEHTITDWKSSVINILNLMLYIFVWYSLLKAFKVWANYGKFYKMLLSGRICKYNFYIFVLFFIANVIHYNFNNKYYEIASGLFLVSLFCLFTVCLFLSFLFYHHKPLRKKIEEFSQITEERIRRHDTPKEVSIAYDQMSLITLLSVVSKRVFDISKDVDFQFIFSKLFKIFCYSVSLVTTCIYTKQLKKISKTLGCVACVIVVLLVCANSSAAREAIANPSFNRTINLIIDYVFLPFGTIKVIVQIITIFIAKRATSISSDYFKIAAFFSMVTALNLIAKGKFTDNTITMSLYKCLLYTSVVVIVMFFNGIEKRSKISGKIKK